MKTWVIILLSICAAMTALVVGCAFLFANVLSGPSKVADEWLAQISKGEYRQAYDAGTPRLREISTYEQFMDFVKLTRLEKNRVALWRSTKINNDSATLAGEIQREDKSAFPVECYLRKIDGIWKVEGLTQK